MRSSQNDKKCIFILIELWVWTLGISMHGWAYKHNSQAAAIIKSKSTWMKKIAIIDLFPFKLTHFKSSSPDQDQDLE